MKNIFKIFLVFTLGFIIFSCKENETDPMLKLNAKGSLSSDKTTLVLNEVTASDNVVKFSWNDPSFNTKVVSAARFLEFAKKGTNFKTVSLFALPATGNEVNITHVQMNNIMAALELAPEQVHQVEVRLKSELNEANIYYSDAIAISVTPYTPNPDLIYPKINVPGGYAGAAGFADWNPGNTFNLFSPTKNNKYWGFIYVTNPNSEFKFTINQDWAGDKGDDNTFTGKLLQEGEVNCKAAVAGTYYIKVDWDANTYSQALANFGIIGDATPTGWSSDTDFTYNPTTKNWEIASISLNSTGIFKFRANDDWGMKLQPASTDETIPNNKTIQTYLSSEGTVQGDPSYKVAEAGNYKVVLNLKNSAVYRLTLTKL